jgi:hypothetical protein
MNSKLNQVIVRYDINKNYTSFAIKSKKGKIKLSVSLYAVAWLRIFCHFSYSYTISDVCKKIFEFAQLSSNQSMKISQRKFQTGITSDINLTFEVNSSLTFTGMIRQNIFPSG